MDTRAQSIGIARYFLALGVGAIMFWILELVTTPLLNRASTTTNNQTANQATSWLSEAISWWPMMLLILSFIGLIVYSVFVRERVR